MNLQLLRIRCLPTWLNNFIPRPPDTEEYNYCAIVVEEGKKYYYWARGVSLEISKDEFDWVRHNPALYDSSIAMRLHLRIDSLINLRKLSEVAKPEEQKSAQFVLAGRPELERFFNEHVVDIIENEARYRVLGIEFPAAIILHGPPGCGKTFAVDRLIDYLGWPRFQIDASSVASSYIHETSKKVAEVFNKAIENAPAVLVIDEMEAYLSERHSGLSGQHHVEEVAEFLRRIPEAIKNRVLIIAMTNRIEMIDPAILRRGRFDHVVKVDMASEEEVRTLLGKLVTDLPSENDIDVGTLAKRLTGRPLSDVAFSVREGARLAARAGKNKLDQSSLLLAMDATPLRSKDEGASRKIGFI